MSIQMYNDSVWTLKKKKEKKKLIIVRTHRKRSFMSEKTHAAFYLYCFLITLIAALDHTTRIE